MQQLLLQVIQEKKLKLAKCFVLPISSQWDHLRSDFTSYSFFSSFYENTCKSQFYFLKKTSWISTRWWEGAPATCSWLLLAYRRQTQVPLPVALGQAASTVSHHPGATHHLRQLVPCAYTNTVDQPEHSMWFFWWPCLLSLSHTHTFLWSVLSMLKRRLELQRQELIYGCSFLIPIVETTMLQHVLYSRYKSTYSKHNWSKNNFNTLL